MNSLVYFLLIFCLVLKTTTSIDGNISEIGANSKNQKVKEDREVGRSIATSYEVDEDANDGIEKREQHEAFRKRAKPLKNIFMGIYKNYKSTYLGNKTSLEYKKTLRDRMSATTSAESASFAAAVPNADEAQPAEAPGEQRQVETKTEPSELGDAYLESRTEPPDTTEIAPKQNDDDDDLDILEEQLTEAMSVTFNAKEAETSPEFKSKVSKKIRKRKRKFRNKQAKIPKTKANSATVTDTDADIDADTDDPLTYIYSVGPGVNMSLDMSNDIVNVNLNADNLLELMHGRWISDNSEQGRGKKYDMVTKVLPLFIIPFLIQSAIVPFLVTKLKLLLLKSILVGKLAIFLLVISAIKNSNKMMQTYEVAPSYWAGEPSRRSELAAVASSAAYNGYRVEGKPTTWIN